MGQSIHNRLRRMGKSRDSMLMLPRSLSEPDSQIALPYVVGVIGDFRGAGSSEVNPHFIEIDRDNFDQVLAHIGPRLQCEVANTLGGGISQMSVRLHFDTMDDFLPARVADKVPVLSKLLETRKRMIELASTISSSDNQSHDLQQLLNLANIPADSSQLEAHDSERTSKSPELSEGASSLLDAVIDETPSQGITSGDSTSYQATDPLLRELLLRAADGTTFVPKQVRRAIDEAIASLDHVVSHQLAEIMHHPDFQRLEGSWRGLKYLIFNTETGPNLKIKVCQWTLDQIRNSFQGTDDIQQTILFRLLYEHPMELIDVEPFALLIGDYEFGPSQADAALLRNIAEVAVVSLCPFVAAASPSFFDLKCWDQLLSLRNLDWINESPDHIKWNSFRDCPEAHYVTLTLPRMLARPLYQVSAHSNSTFEFQEFERDPKTESDNPPHDSYLWTNSAYALGACITRAYAETGWCVSICCLDNGGLVTGLPIRNYKDTISGSTYECSTETRMPSRQETELNKLGFTPLMHLPGHDAAAFSGPRSIYRPPRFTDKEQTANEYIAARLPCILATSRVAQHVRVIIQNLSGHIGSRVELEAGLNNWLRYYVGESEKVPLRKGNIEIRADHTDSSLVVELQIQPHLLLEELTQPVTILL